MLLMKMKNVVVCFFILTMSSCHVKTQNESALFSVEIIRNLNKESEPKDDPLSFKNVEIIALETNEQCLLGSVPRIKVTDSFIFVREFFTNDLFVFDRKGIFLNKIGNVGQGKGEYISLKSFYIDSYDHSCVVIDEMKGSLLYYHFDGSFKAEKKIPLDLIKSSTSSFLIKENVLLINYLVNFEANMAYHIIDLDKLRSVGGRINYPIKFSDYMYEFSKHPITYTEDGFDVIMPLCDTIFSYTTKGFRPGYIVGHSLKMTPFDCINNEKNKIYPTLLMENGQSGYFTGFTAIFETKKHLLLNYLVEGTLDGYFLADKGRGEGSYYIHSTDEEIISMPFFCIVDVNGEDFISLCDADYLLNLKDRIQESDDPYLGKLKSVLDHLKEDDNPVLIFYTLEDSL
jgi:hypothetical protein